MASDEMVMWRVSLHGYVRHQVSGRYGVSASITEIIDVEAPATGLEAAARMAMARLRTIRRDMSVYRVDVKRLENRTPPSHIAQQATLFD